METIWNITLGFVMGLIIATVLFGPIILGLVGRGPGAQRLGLWRSGRRGAGPQGRRIDTRFARKNLARPQGESDAT